MCAVQLTTRARESDPVKCAQYAQKVFNNFSTEQFVFIDESSAVSFVASLGGLLRLFFEGAAVVLHNTDVLDSFDAFSTYV